MVSREHIIESIDKSILFVQKCWTIASMSEKLASYSHDEKRELLQGRLTPLEWEDYNHIMEYYNEEMDGVQEIKDMIDNGELEESKLSRVSEYIDEIEENLNKQLFKYERRIIENYLVPNNPVPIIDESQYIHDESVPITEDYENNYGKGRINPIEAEQIRLQDSEVYFTDKEISWLSGYFLGDYTYITRRINNDTEYLGEIMSQSEINRMDKEFPNIKKHMDNAISKTHGLVQPTILYHSGRVDPSLVPGSHGVWKSYTSASFQEGTMKTYHRDNPSDWEIVIYAPQGTKGVCGNGNQYYNGGSIGQLNQYTWEHEYLLGRNTGYTVVSMDYENHRQVVILDEA